MHSSSRNRRTGQHRHVVTSTLQLLTCSRSLHGHLQPPPSALGAGIRRCKPINMLRLSCTSPRCSGCFLRCSRQRAYAEPSVHGRNGIRARRTGRPVWRPRHQCLRDPNRLFASHLTGRAGNPCRNASLLYTGVESLIHAIPRSGCCKAANRALCMSLIWRFSSVRAETCR